MKLSSLQEEEKLLF